MKKIFFIFAIIGIVVAIWAAMTIRYKTTNSANELQIAATIFPLSDIAQNIAGDRARVINILPAGASPHTFDVTPSVIRKLQGTKELFIIGHGLDEWAAAIAAALPGLKIYRVDSGITLQPFGMGQHLTSDDEADLEESGFDPHYWLSVANAKIIASNIASELIRLDPQNAAIYQKHLSDYLSQLTALQTEVRALLSDISNDKLIVFHDSWGYFADEFGLTILGVFELRPGVEPSPQYLQKLYNLVLANQIKVVFSEPQFSADVLQSFISDLGLRVAVLDPLGGVAGRESYIDLIRYNAQTISQIY
jgi:zinc transport system substrate-binding protein